MSVAQLALANLLKARPGARANGLPAAIRKMTSSEFGSYSPGFVPDATEVRGDTLFILEIEDTNPLTDHKLERIKLFAHDFYDETGLYTVLIVTDRYGMNERQIWAVADEIGWQDVTTGEVMSETEFNRCKPAIHEHV